LQVPFEKFVLGRSKGSVFSSWFFQGDLVLAACGQEANGNVKTGSGLLGSGLEHGEAVFVLRVVTLCVFHGTIDMQGTDILIAVRGRQREPKASIVRGILCGWEMNLIGEFEGSRGDFGRGIRLSYVRGIGGWAESGYRG